MTTRPTPSDRRCSGEPAGGACVWCDGAAQLPRLTTAATRPSRTFPGSDDRRAPRDATAGTFSLSSDRGSTQAPVAVCLHTASRTGFSLVELLVVVGVMAVLSALIVPALASARSAARETQGVSQTRQIGTATLAHMNDHHGRLPQLRLDPTGQESSQPEAVHLSWLFGGARPAVDVFGSAGIGADRKPLNSYLGEYAPDERPEMFLDPLDAGTHDPLLAAFAPDGAEEPAVFDLVGTSYVLNDHALDTVPCPFVEIFDTLIPRGGGAAPEIVTPARTWLAGQSPIYNYDDGEDRGQLWGRDRVRASLAFADGHAETALPVEPGPVNTTPHYTFFPRPGWEKRFEHLTGLGGVHR